MPLVLRGRQLHIGNEAGQATPHNESHEKDTGRAHVTQTDHRVSLLHQLSTREIRASMLRFIQMQKWETIDE